MSGPIDDLAIYIAALERRIADLERRPAFGFGGTRITTGATAAAGWALVDVDCQIVGRVAWVAFTLDRTGADIAVTATGDITNIDLVTAPPEVSGSSTLWQPLASGPSGRVAAGHFRATTGMVRLTAVGAAADIGTGDRISLGGCVLLGH